MRLLITGLILISFGSISMASIGDLYYCEMKEAIAIKGVNLIKIQLQKFVFKWTGDKILMGSDNNYFKDLDLDII